jgi:hypothetical protein
MRWQELMLHPWQWDRLPLRDGDPRDKVRQLREDMEAAAKRHASTGKLGVCVCCGSMSADDWNRPHVAPYENNGNHCNFPFRRPTADESKLGPEYSQIKSLLLWAHTLVERVASEPALIAQPVEHVEASEDDEHYSEGDMMKGELARAVEILQRVCELAHVDDIPKDPLEKGERLIVLEENAGATTKAKPTKGRTS